MATAAGERIYDRATTKWLGQAPKPAAPLTPPRAVVAESRDADGLRRLELACGHGCVTRLEGVIEQTSCCLCAAYDYGGMLMATIKRDKLKNGAYVYRMRYVAGYTAKGAPIQKMASFPTMAEAKAAGKRLETDRDRGVAPADGKLRLAAYLAEWLTRAGRRVRPSTLAGYRSAVEARIVPVLGQLKLRDLTRATLQRWIDQLATPDLAHRCHAVLHIALAEAVDLELLPANPSSRLKLPERGWRQGTSWSVEEARAFLAVAKGHTQAAYWLLGVRSGLRPSELLGLRWASLDLDAGTLAVVEARPTVGSGRFHGAPKSLSGHRTLDLPADVVATLRAHKAAQNEIRLKCAGWEELDLVCCGRRGLPLELTNLRDAFNRLIAAAGVRKIRLYDLRHTAISIMAESGADFKAISEIAGHADVRLTRQVYQHVGRHQRRAALAALGDALASPAEIADTGS